MSRALLGRIGSVQNLLALQPEELGSLILETLNSEPAWGFRREGLFQELSLGLPGVEVQEAVGDAIAWLEAEGLLAARPLFPPESGEVSFVTRRGRELRTRADLVAFRQARMLPKHLLHPLIAERAQAAFLRGEYDAAVFAAFKAVGVAVRKTSRLPDDLLGTRLMSEAFNPAKGPLSAMKDPIAEREAVRNLFVGAIGHCKNPQSHRDEVVPPEEACHLLLFASYLLRLVDLRAAES